MLHRLLLPGALLACSSLPATAQQNFADIKPSPQQVAWQDLEIGAIIHFGTNTFLDREWGDGTASPSVFNPTHVDTDQWMAAAKSAGIGYVVQVAKHHDGFALWPTAESDYSVKASPWLGGKGDLIRMASDSAHKAGLRFGVYESPWDRHDPRYKDPVAYDTFYLAELTELASGYGPLEEFWLDGAGSTGRTYDFDKIIRNLRTYQSNTLVFGDVGLYRNGDIRWVGTESGRVDFDVWNTVDNSGMLRWRPVEADTPLHRLQWFWHPNSDSTLKTVDELMTTYNETVGRGAQLMLGLAPDRTGNLPAADVKRLAEFGARLQALYGPGKNLLSSAPRVLPAEAAPALSEDHHSAWATGTALPATLTVTLAGPVQLDRFLTMERLEDGQHVEEYAVEAKLSGDTTGQWHELVHAHVIGHKKIDLLPAPVQATAVRLRILAANGPVEMRAFGAYSGKVQNIGAPSMGSPAE
ncbi:alpha-L-fucosidase [Acidipila sp. EB88]|uniref:alpha-L-fucosidase n=1 Tax=Acidipila sp. EB88 TaxID=2305226 RepID=UPI000F5F586A|nr:alpha-L-fucosidase [Acidipila sp. EB88]RRA49882.1 alpha-L-fucosidase [Acidipila sp. EB88]